MSIVVKVVLGRLAPAAALAACLVLPAAAADRPTDFVFRYMNKVILAGNGIDDGDTFCETGEEGSPDCDGVCDPGDEPGSPDCPVDDDDDDGDGICEVGETGADCNQTCDPEDEQGSVDCEEGEEPDHEPEGMLINADMETSGGWMEMSSGREISRWSNVWAGNEATSEKQVGGEGYFSSYSTDHSYQDVPVPSELAASGFRVEYNWLQASNVVSDSGQVEAVFLNEEGAEIGRLSPGARAVVPADMWIERRAEADAPAGTKTVRVIMASAAGRPFYDNIDLRINGIKYSRINGHYGMPPRPADRLYAATEHAPTSTMNQMGGSKWWRRIDGATQFFMSDYVNPFHGAPANQYSTTCCSGGAAEFNQVVYVGPGHGGREFWLEWFQSGNAASVRAEFYSRYEGALLGALTPEHVATPADMGTMAFRSHETILPDGTEFIRIVMKVERRAAVADIGMGIGNGNWSRRDLAEGSGHPTTCEAFRSHNPTFADTGAGQGQHWFVGNFSTSWVQRGDSWFPRMSYNGTARQMICVPRKLKKTFGGVYWTFLNIRVDDSIGGGRFDVDFYDNDMRLIHAGSTGARLDGVGPGSWMHYGYIGAYGTVDAPAGNLNDVSSILIRSTRSSGTFWADNVMFGDGEFPAMPGWGYEFDWSDPGIMAVSGRSYRR